ncbi:transmembrane emp24 domain-containing protein 7-like [Oscarella lobularis]|uniref:transmembrane emp24 domain-containing protein 7-like n=1 Tax=Oscarella lobularis TaxID=121494 RepID=UPI00331361DE
MVPFLLVLALVGTATAVELTFELRQHDKMCFHEELKMDVAATLEFQVIYGGQFDVDMILRGPDDNEIYSTQKKQYDSHTFSATKAGVYSFCFSNEFSTFAHKTVYFDFYVESQEDAIRDAMAGEGVGGADHTVTQLESSLLTIHDNLKVINDYQTHFRLREAQGRAIIEHVWERVTYWSIGETFLIVFVGFGQVFVLRRFFAEKRSSI